MNRILFAMLVAASVPLFASDDKLNDIRPDAARKTDAPTGVEWQNANDRALAAETLDEALAAVVADKASAMALLGKIKGAYLTDAMIATRAAAVSQYVMIGSDAAWYEFWRTSRQRERDVWTEALIATARSAEDSYVKQFCLDQLRWCGRFSQAAQVRDIGSASSSREVKDFADVVARELESCPSVP